MKKHILNIILTVSMVLQLCMPTSSVMASEFGGAGGAIVEGSAAIDILINAGTNSTVLAGDLKDKLYENVMGKLKSQGLGDVNVRISTPAANLNTTDLSNWYVYDHYDSGYYGSESAWSAASEVGHGANTTLRPYFSHAQVASGVVTPAEDRSSHGIPKITLNEWINSKQPLKNYGVAGVGSGVATLGTFDQHILSHEKDGVPMIDFVGYFNSGYHDFIFYPCESNEEKLVTFDIKTKEVNPHTLKSAGFLFNAGITGTGADAVISGYVLYYVYPGTGNDPVGTAPTKLILYKIKDGMKAAALHNDAAGSGTISASNYSNLFDEIASVPIGATNWPDVDSDATDLSITLNITPDSITVYQMPKGQLPTASDKPILEKNGLTRTNYNGFGPMIGYLPHACVRATRFTYSNIKMAYINQSDDIFDVLSQANFVQNAKLYFIDLTDDGKNRSDDGNNQFKAAAGYMQAKEIRYVTNHTNDFLTDGGSEIDEADSYSIPLRGNGKTVYDEGGSPNGERELEALAEKIAQYIIDTFNKPLSDYDGLLPQTKPIALLSLVQDPNELTNASYISEIRRDFINNGEGISVYGYDELSIPSTPSEDDDESSNEIIAYNYTLTYPDGRDPKIYQTSTTPNQKLFEITNDITDWPIGTYTVTLVVEDDTATNNISSPVTVEFKVVEDKIAPAVPEVKLSGKDLSFNASDIGGYGVTKYELKFTPTGEGESTTMPYNVSPASTIGSQTSPQTIAIPDINWPEGSYTLELIVYDMAGNSTTVKVPTINFKDEKLYGLEPSKAYPAPTVPDEDKYTNLGSASESGEIEIDDEWLGEDITYRDADTDVTISLPTRPVAPDVTPVGTAKGKNEGKISGVDNTMEYKDDESVEYTPISLEEDADEITELPAGTYYIRYEATDSEFASAVAEVVVSELPTYTISGTVKTYGDEGTSVKGATVKITLKGEEEAITTLETDNEGSFVFPDMFVGDYTLVVTGPNNNIVTREVTVTDKNVVENIVLQQTYTIGGTVKTENGRNVPNAVVVVTLGDGTKIETKTNSAGYFELPDMPNGGYTLVVTSPDGQSATQPVTVNGADITEDITVSNAYILSGTVETSEGIFVEGATVKLTLSGVEEYIATITTDTNGTFEFTDVPNGSYTLVVKGPNNNIITKDITIANANVTAKIVLQKTYTINGTVKTENGRNVPNATVTVTLGDKTVIEVRTNTAGYFELTDMPNGDYILDVKSPDGQAAREQVTVNSNDVTANITVSNAYTINGAVETFEGSLVEGATVELTLSGKEESIATIATDAKGAFEFIDIPNGSYTLVVKGPNNNIATKSVTVANNHVTERIVLQQTHMISGTVRTENGRNVPNATVVVTLGDGTKIETKTNTAGYFELPDMPDGGYTLVATSPDGQSTTQQVTVNGADVTEDIAVSNAYAIIGTVETFEGNLVEGATVKLTLRGTEESIATIATNAKGAFEFTDVPNGIYTLVVTGPNNNIVTKDVTIANGNVTEKIVLQKTYKINAVVKNSAGKLIEGAIVVVTSKDLEDPIATITTNAKGALLVTDLPPGVYTLVTTVDGELASGRVTIVDGKKEVYEAVLQLKLTSGSTTPGDTTSGNTTANGVINVEKIEQVAVDGLQKQIEAPPVQERTKGVTQEDLDVVKDGGKLAIELTIADVDEEESKPESGVPSIKEEVRIAGQNVGFFIDVSVEKFLWDAGNELIERYGMVELPELITLTIPLPSELLGMDPYTIYRYHDDAVDEILENPNEHGEYFRILSNGIQEAKVLSDARVAAVTYSMPDYDDALVPELTPDYDNVFVPELTTENTSGSALTISEAENDDAIVPALRFAVSSEGSDSTQALSGPVIELHIRRFSTYAFAYTMASETPFINSHPQNLTIALGGRAPLSVEASVADGGTLTYQWYSNTTGSTSDGVLIDGATSSTYDPPTNSVGTIYYYVVITNTAGNKEPIVVTSNLSSVTVRDHSGSSNYGDSTRSSSPTINTVNINRIGTGLGTVTLNPTNPKSGDRVTVTIKPNDGYELADLTIMEYTGKKVSFTDNGDGTYTYTQPDNQVKVDANFKLIATAIVPLSVPAPVPAPTSSEPGRKDSDVSGLLNTADHMSYVSGRGNDMFYPNTNMTRAEAAQMFYNLLRNKNTDITASFNDVPDNAWYAKAVNTLATLGIITGFPDGSFDPEENITRAQFATIVVRFAKMSQGSTRFDDVLATHWAYDYINTAANFEWVTGVGDRRFEPDRNITRAEAVTLTNRMLERYPDKEHIDSNSGLVRFSDADAAHWAYYNIMEAASSHKYEKNGTAETWE